MTPRDRDGSFTHTHGVMHLFPTGVKKVQTGIQMYAAGFGSRLTEGLGDKSLLLPKSFPSLRLQTWHFTWHRKREQRCQCDSPTPRECSPAENAYTAAD